MGLKEEAAEEFVALMSLVATGNKIDEYITPAQVLLVEAACSVQFAYVTQRCIELQEHPQIGAASFMPSGPKGD